MRSGAPATAALIPILPILAAAVALCAAAARLYLVSFGGPLHFPLACPFRLITGFPCPTCGATRALAALAAADPLAALTFNPLAAIVALVLVFSGVLSLAAKALHLELAAPRPAPSTQRLLRAGAATLILANWAYLILRR